jgi:LysM repeat protein
MRRVSASILILFLLGLGFQPVSAQEFVRISGQISAPTGVVLESASVLFANGQYSANADGSGNYEVIVPKGLTSEFVFLTTIRSEGVSKEKAQPTFANWKTLVTFHESRTLDFAVPKPNKVSIRFVDAQDQPLTLVKLRELNGNDQHDPISESGFTWTGLHRLADPVNRPGWGAWSETGYLDILLFDDSQHQGFSHSGFEFEGRGKNTPPGFTAKFRVSPNMEIKLCHAVNFGPSLTFPSGCFMTRAEQESTPIPTPTPSASLPSGSTEVTYRIAAGDTIASIARKFGISAIALQNFNNILDPNLIKVGQLLKIPGVTSSTPSSSPTPAPIKYKNCAALQRVYAGGVALSSRSVNKGGKIKRKPTVNARVYTLNKSLDRDGDGMVCER